MSNMANNDAHLDSLRQARKNFMIVFKLSESDGTIENQYASDMALVEEMLVVMELEQYKGRIINATRLGRDNGLGMRPLRVEFASYMDRETVVRNGYHLAGSADFRAVGVSRDLIMADRIISRNNYLVKKQQNQHNDAGTGASATTSQNTVQEAQPLAEASDETATQVITNSTAAGDGDQAPPQIAEETPEP